MAEYYTTDEAAKLCKVSRSTVFRWIQEGKLNASVTVGGHHRIFQEELFKLMESLRLPLPVEQAEDKLEKTALIVDDEEPMRRVLRFFIMKYFPYFQIEEAADGFDAGMKIQRFKPELVLLDLRIPGQDGLSVCKQIRSMPEFEKMVILIITGVQDELVLESSMIFGANDYLLKPFEPEELKEKIEKHLLVSRQARKAS